MDPLADWLLTAEERGNPATSLPAWTEGNLVEPLVHGTEYFDRLVECVEALDEGDHLFFTDWRGDPDEELRPGGPTVAQLFTEAVRRGVCVRGLVWRSHWDALSFSKRENRALDREIEHGGGEVILDQRVRRNGSHHQKFVVCRHDQDPTKDVAFVGGIDLCHGRRDDVEHGGDPQQSPIDRRYGDRAPWHDATLELRGPVVGEVLRTFVERWDDPHPLDRRSPYRMLLQRLARMPRHPERLPESFPDPPPAGRHAVQLLRTYGARRPPYPFAPAGERTVAQAYGHAFSRARTLIYLEDQYLWSEPVAQGIAEALERAPELRLVAVVPRYPDADGRLTGPPNRLGQITAMALLQQVAPDRVAFFDLENAHGVPVYVHAKICVVDDVWCTCGSDNFNRRSWTNDSELTCAVLDPEPDEREPRDLSSTGHGARRLARDLRLETWSEHLALPRERLVDPVAAWDLWRQRADALDAWHAGGRQGPRPPGQVRRHVPDPVTRLQRLWAEPVHRVVFDPDGRPRSLRRSGRF